MREVSIHGAAMTRFGKHVARTARELVEEAVAGALDDAGIQPADVQGVYVGNASSGIVSGQESVRGQVVLRHTGLLGVPIVNVENADASGSTALHLGWQAVASGAQDCVVVLGYEKLDHVDRARTFRAVNATLDLTELADVFGPDAREERTVLMDLYSVSPAGDNERFSRAGLAGRGGTGDQADVRPVQRRRRVPRPPRRRRRTVALARRPDHVLRARLRPRRRHGPAPLRAGGDQAGIRPRRRGPRGP